MAKPTISNEDLCRNAKRIRTGVAEIKTFLAVETKNKGFDAQDRPLILFERHWFHKLTKGKFSKTHPDISNPKAGGYGTSASQYGRFNKAFELDPQAAMKSASWGLGQVMGFNHRVAGYDTVDEFVSAMKESEGKQLDAAVSFILHNNLGDELRNHNWAGFAKGYNGAGYRKNKYDTKLAQFYAKFSKGPQVDCSNLSKLVEKTVDSRPVFENVVDMENPDAGIPDSGIVVNDPLSVDSSLAPMDGETGDPPKPGEPAPDQPAEEGQPVVGGRPQDPPIIISQPEEKAPSGWKTWTTTVTATLGSLGLTVGGLFTSLSGIELSPTMQIVLGWLIVLGVVGAAVYGLFYLISRAWAKHNETKMSHEIVLKELELRSMPDRYNVKLDRRGDTSNLTASGLGKPDDSRNLSIAPKAEEKPTEDI